MKKYVSRGIAAAAFAGMVLTLQAQDTNIDQSQFPTILQQPIDACVPVGSLATFSVVATNADGYQWYRNNIALDGATNNSFTIQSVTTNDVAYYSASVFKGSEGVPTRMAGLNVYMTSSSTPTTTTKTMSMMSMTTMTTTTTMGDGGPIVVFGLPVVSGGSSGSCPGAYSGYVNYIKPMTNGWGFTPDTNTTIHTAADLNQSDTKVQAVGYYGDVYCNSNSITVPDPTLSPKYRFTIYFPKGSQVPTNAYPITLTGFNQ